jgi:hypothetical protein
MDRPLDFEDELNSGINPDVHLSVTISPDHIREFYAAVAESKF